MRRYIGLFALLIVITVCPITVQAQSVLQTTADAMAADSWAILMTNGITCTTLLETVGCDGITSTATNNITSDASRGCWDPIAQRMHFTGQGHTSATSPMRHVYYDAASNTWVRVSPNPPFGGSADGTVSHNWNFQACDTRGRFMYRGKIGTLNVWRYTFGTPQGTQGWVSLGAPPTSVISYPNGFPGFTFYPERGSIGHLLVTGVESGSNGVMAAFDPATNTWARIGGLIPNFDATYSMAEYSDIHKIVLFGGGTAGTGVFRQLDSRGNITAAASPSGCNASENRDGIIHADPVTGNFVLLCGGGAASWAIYNPVTNVWTAKTSPAGIAAHILNFPATDFTWPTWGTIGAPIWDHGVIMYVKCNTGACQVSLYKGGSFGTADRDFKRRCWAVGVIRCVGFDSPLDTAGVLGDRTSLSGGSRDTTTKASGLGSITFSTPPGVDFGSTFYYYANWRDDVSQKLDPGGEVWIQWRQRFDTNWLSGTIPTFKQGMIAGTGDLPAAAPGNTINIESGGPFATSCSQLEIVWQHIVSRGFPVIYHACPGTRVPSWSADSRPCAGPNNPAGTGCLSNTDFIIQNIPNCTYQSNRSACWHYQANEWATFKVHVKASTPYYNNTGVFSHTGTLEAWVAREGQPSVKIYDFRHGVDTACDALSSTDMPSCQTGMDHNNHSYPTFKYGKTWLLPYSNGEVFPNGGQTWYDELIISTNPIADPGSKTLAPAAPTNPTVR